MRRIESSARLAAMAVLFCNGLLYSTWGVSVPLIKEKFQVSDGMLSLSMAAVAIGGLVTMMAAARWIARRGSGSASVYSGLGMAATAAAILLIPTYPALLALLFVYGMATAANDVAANAQVAYLEKLSGRSLIGSAHGSFSVGGLTGALVAGWWSSSSIPPAANFFVLGTASALALFCASRALRNEGKGETSATGACEVSSVPSAPSNRIVRTRLRIFGALAFAALVIEGAFYDWAAVYMKEVAQAPESWIGFGYAAFAIAMAVGRLCGDWIRDRLRHEAMVGSSGLVCMAGLVVILINSSPIVVVLGFAVTGIGLSNFIPILFSSAGKIAIQAGWPAAMGLAATTRIAYAGLLTGPLVIGPLAEVVGLRFSLLGLVAAVAAICLGWLVLSRSTGGEPWSVPTGSQAAPPSGHSRLASASTRN